MACLESLGYNSGELYEAALEALKAFLKSNPQRRNGEVQPSDAEACDLKRAAASHPKLPEWLGSELESSRGNPILWRLHLSWQ